MQTRIFGRTGHASTVAIFGGAVLGKLDQATTDQVVRQMLDAGVNHIDIAPSYGNAEALIGPWMPQIRKDFFLGCKTTQRTQAGAAAEMRESLRRLRVDSFDLFQAHAVTSMAELDLVTGPGGALEAMVAAKQAGLTRFLGITGHGYQSPVVFLEALRRFDFDTVLFPINFVQYADPVYRQNAEALLAEGGAGSRMPQAQRGHHDHQVDLQGAVGRARARIPHLVRALRPGCADPARGQFRAVAGRDRVVHRRRLPRLPKDAEGVRELHAALRGRAGRPDRHRRPIRPPVRRGLALLFH